MATHSSILAWRIPMDRGTWQATVHEVTNELLKYNQNHFQQLFRVSERKAQSFSSERTRYISHITLEVSCREELVIYWETALSRSQLFRLCDSDSSVAMFSSVQSLSRVQFFAQPCYTSVNCRQLIVLKSHSCLETSRFYPLTSLAEKSYLCPHWHIASIVSDLQMPVFCGLSFDLVATSDQFPH